MRPVKQLISISLDTSASQTDAMRSAQRTFQTLPSRAMASWSEFVRIEADLAMSFIDAARIHSNPANSARSLGNARKALAEIQRGLMKSTARGLSEGEVSFLKQRCTEIELTIATF